MTSQVRVLVRGGSLLLQRVRNDDRHVVPVLLRRLQGERRECRQGVLHEHLTHGRFLKFMLNSFSGYQLLKILSPIIA